MRDYGAEGQLGLERTPEEYVAKMVAVFREVRRVLRDDGTLWLNLGDSYATHADKRSGQFGKPIIAGMDGISTKSKVPAHEIGMKEKDLCGIPWRVAFALQADGWYLRQDIIWSKPNPMPESVTDRCTKSHEYVFLLSKSAKYYYDNEAIKETSCGRENFYGSPNYSIGSGRNDSNSLDLETKDTRNRRSVWHIATAPFAEAHFATYPPKLIEPMIMAGTSEKGNCEKCGKPWERVVDIVSHPSGKKVDWPGWPKDENGKAIKCGNPIQDPAPGAPTVTTLGWRPACKCDAGVVKPVVLDPFFGAGTTGLVAKKLLRDYIGIELNEAYIKMAQKRIDSIGEMLPLEMN